MNHDKYLHYSLPVFERWSSKFPYHRPWDDIQTLVDQLLEERSASSWNHLVFAVGNYKRQGGTVIRSYMPKNDDRKPVRKLNVSFALFDENGHKLDDDITCEDSDSWKPLNAIGGIGLPTLSTVLAALWPDRHVIFDQRTARSICGLAGYQDDWGGPADPSKKNRRASTPNDYNWYRRYLINTASNLSTATSALSLIDVERSLFQLDITEREINGKQPNRSWGAFAAAMHDLFLNGKPGEKYGA